MGNPNSTESDTPFNEHFFGLVNALYFCKPFRDKVIQYKLAYNQRTAHLSKDGSAATAAGQLNNSNDQQYDVSNGSSILSNISNLNSSNSNLTASAAAAGVNGTTTNNVNTTTTSKTTLTSSSTTSASSNSQASNGSVANVSILKQEHLLNCLAELFFSIVTMRKKKGTVQPKKFIARLRKDNDAFDNLFQQDAHEFLNYLLNTCADILKEEMKELKKLEELNGLSENGAMSATSKLSSKTHRILNGKLIGNGNNVINNSQPSNGSNFSSGSTTSSRTNSTNGSSRSISSQSNVNGSSSNKNQPQQQQQQQQQQSNPANESNSEELTWIHELFQGILVNETKCLNCETSSSKEENFLDLSVDVEQNTSLSHCLQEFSNMEMLCGECKYYCETCCSKQEAEKRMRIKKLPKILALHLKRFKFVGMLNKFKKLTYRVVFPFELRLFNTTEDCKNSDRIYDLVSFVVHCGMGLNRGHYISVVKSHGYWFLFDDEQVERIEVSNFEEFYGLTQDTNKKSETSYILFYETRES